MTNVNLSVPIIILLFGALVVILGILFTIVISIKSKCDHMWIHYNYKKIYDSKEILLSSTHVYQCSKCKEFKEIIEKLE